MKLLCIVAMMLAVAACKNPSIGSGSGKDPQPPPTTYPTNSVAATAPSPTCNGQSAQPYGTSSAVSPDQVYTSSDSCPPPKSTEQTAPSGQPKAKDAPSPNYDSRGGKKISGIVLHNTVGRYAGSLSHLRNPKARVSAHILIGRNGEISRLVADEYAAWHAVQMNKSTLGVELEAFTPGQGIAAEQEKVLLQQIKFWMQKYQLAPTQVTIHREHVNTECPSYVWPTNDAFLRWRNSKPL